MEQPLVSIVIPFYSNKSWLLEAFESVYTQTYKNFEIILVNDGSKENINDILEQYADVIYIYQDNNGAGSARNKGISVAKGKYITFLDSDDIWLPKKLEIQVNYMETNEGVMWSHCSYKTFGGGKEKIMPSRNAEGDMFPKCFISCKIATPCIMIRKSVFENNLELRFNEKMRYGQDFYLWVLLCKDYELGIQDEILCKVRMRGNNAAKRAYVMLKSKKELMEQLRENSSMNIKQIPISIRLCYFLCTLGFIATHLLEKFIKNQNIIELIAREFYLIPYILLKMLGKMKWN